MQIEIAALRNLRDKLCGEYYDELELCGERFDFSHNAFHVVESGVFVVVDFSGPRSD
ncbi:MAG TPA: hypothetical protein VFA48_14910 [Gammaproteobacteria bacterium]|nr:hypothetical protein [Gammaproteobacteria bacterium]